MEEQGLIVEDNLKTIIFNYIRKCIHWFDHTIFKIVVDYIIRNFDPTGINIWGLIDSLYHVMIRPRLLWFAPMIKPLVNFYHKKHSALRLFIGRVKVVFNNSLLQLEWMLTKLVYA